MTPNDLWVEKYRPKNFSEMILSESYAKLFTSFLDKGTLSHLLLVGRVGCGKTTTARILIDTLDCASLELNASDERGIDVVRTKIKSFVQSKSFHKWKIVFLDEADALTREAQDSLRNLMETYSDHARFILTANYENKIIPALQSRCQVVRFGRLPRKEVFHLLSKIAKAEGLQLDPETILDVLDDSYPDIRKALNLLQVNTRDGKVLYTKETTLLETVRECIEKGDLKQLRQKIAEENPDFIALYRGLFDFATQNRAMLTIVKYMYQDSLVADREMNFAALCVELIGERK